MKQIINNVLNRIKIFQSKRIGNTEKYKATNFLLVVLFPVFISVLAEIVHMKTPKNFIIFLFHRPSIVLFSIILTSVFFLILLLIFRKAYIPTTIIGIALTFLSIVELFKFNTSGNHLILTDMKMAANVGNLTRFAYIKITPSLVLYVAIMFIYLIAVFWFNPVLKTKSLKRLIPAGLCSASLIFVITTPQIALPVYSAFKIDISSTDNVFRLNQKFDNNNLIAFLAQTTTEFINRKVEEPKDYNVEAISKMLENVPKDNTNFKKPNVIVIQSEAFADFRIFKDLNINENIYKSYDNIRNSSKSYAGEAIVPTFGSFTVKTEFELMFGLPTKSLNDPNMPQRLLLDRPQETIASYYKQLGYNTSYIHTFAKTFYSRERVYANCGYDNMIFDDNLTVPIEYYEAYISDTTIFNQINKIFDETDEPSFVYTTTMQNHQPYNPTEKYPTQLDYYLAGIEDMTKNLEKFVNSIKEPTVILFIGDHFPCFKGEESIYNQLDINGENCNNLYVQSYFIWNNYGMDYQKAPKNLISAFYLPYVVLDLIDAPKSDFTQTMLDKMKHIPVYSTNYDNTTPHDEQLDMFTYDVVLGKQYIKED